MINQRNVAVCLFSLVSLGMLSVAHLVVAEENEGVKKDSRFFGVEVDEAKVLSAPIIHKLPYVQRLFKNIGKDGAENLDVDFQICVAADEAKCKSQCQSQCVAAGACRSCPLESTSAKSCSCGTNCQCSKNAQAHVVKIHEKLVKALTENSQLKAKLEATCQVAKQKENYVHGLVEARTEIAELHARLEFAREKEKLVDQLVDAKVQNVALEARLDFVEEHKELIAELTKLHADKHKSVAASHHISIASELKQSKTENALLKQRLAKLEQHVQELTERLSERELPKRTISR